MKTQASSPSRLASVLCPALRRGETLSCAPATRGPALASPPEERHCPHLRWKIHGALCLAAALFALAGCRKRTAALSVDESPGPFVSANHITFRAHAPELGSLVVADAKECSGGALRLNGRLVWDDNVSVRVFSPFAGRVTRVAAEIGAIVDKETPLAAIASPDFGQAQADARKAATDLAQTERNVTRLRELFDHGAAAAKDVAAAESDLARAQSEAVRTKARLALYGATAETIDNNYALKSPIGGVVVERNVSTGQEVRPDQMLAGLDKIAAPLFVVTDPTRLWVQLDVPETELAKIHRGQAVQVRSTTMPDRALPATIEIIADALDPTSRTVRARASLANPERLLKSEMLVLVEVPSPARQTVEVPSKAVLFLHGRHYAFAQIGPQSFERREVEPGAVHDNVVQVVAGLRCGERVVADGALLLEQIWEQRSQTAAAKDPNQAASDTRPGPFQLAVLERKPALPSA